MKQGFESEDRMAEKPQGNVFAGQVALVTGGGKRVGRAIALGLGRAGANVVVNYNTSRDGAAEVVKEIEAMGRKAIAVQADVSKRSGRRADSGSRRRNKHSAGSTFS